MQRVSNDYPVQTLTVAVIHSQYTHCWETFLFQDKELTLNQHAFVDASTSGQTLCLCQTRLTESRLTQLTDIYLSVCMYIWVCVCVCVSVAVSHWFL